MIPVARRATVRAKSQRPKQVSRPQQKQRDFGSPL